MSTLGHLIHPFDRDIFVRDYWEQQPLLVKRGDPTYYHDLLSLSDIDSILCTSNFSGNTIRLARDGKETSVKELLANLPTEAAEPLEAIYSYYREGSTIILPFLHERWKPLKQLCRLLAQEFSAGFQVNVYVTPPHAQGFARHYDTHDVFILQTDGVKRWRSFAVPIRLPLARPPHQAG